MRRQIKLFGSNLVIAAAYFSGGILGMMLAFAPSNASPIWPASGIALGGLLICGKKILPGLFIGALATQIYAFADTSSLPKIIDSIWIGSVIGIASCLQATVGAKLIHRFVGKDNPLIEDRKILYFFLLGGPLSSTISATIGISTLYLKGIISVNDYAISWGTWWVGDSIGVLVVTPLILCYFAQPKKQWKKRRKNFPLPLFTLLALVLLVFYYSHQKEKVRIEAAFERQVFLLHKTLNDEVHHHFETSQILKGLFDSLPDITEEQFKIFATPIIQRRATIQALEWIPKVASHEKIQFEKENGIDIRERGEHNRMIGVLQRDEYFPILYLYPYETNEKALGYDIGSNPSASKALQTARDSGKTVSSEKLWLIQDKVRKAGIILYTPVYDTPDPGNSVELRRKSFKGVIALVFRIESEMLEALSHLTDFQLLTEIRDGKSVLYSDFPKKVPHKFDNFSLQKNLSINVGDRLWLLTFKPSDLFVHDHTSWTIWWILLGGLLFTGMMGMGLLVLTGRTAYVEKLVDIKTDDLREANQRLNKEIKLRLDLEDEQNFRYKILEMLSSELPLEKILLHIVIGAEKTRPGTICVIMLLDEQGKFFRHSVAPSLPDFYNRAMDGLAVGPGIGSCGTAAFTGSRVIVEDIRNHPYWEDYQSLLTRTQLHACWSEPIFSSKNKVLGTFAIYYKEKRSPARRDLDFIYRMGQLAGIVIEHKRDEEELRIAATTFESHEAIMITAADGSILRVNRSFSKITGYSEEEAIGQNPKILASGQHKVEFFQNMYRILEHKSQWRGEIWNKRKNGEIYPERLTITAVKNESGKVSHYVAIFSDITEKKKAEREIRNLAFYDSLTGLPNRRLLLNRLEQELVSARRHQLFGSLIYLDLDRFKVINDSLGHHIGDQLLIQV
ncbi:MAG: CHASE domain-containing protein, partial [Gammaproteobacteria bacterium]